MESGRRALIFVADDFGADRRVNEAVIEAHHGGLLRAASLMVAAGAAEHAVALAREAPGLEIGLHLVLCQGSPVLERRRLKGLVRGDGRFSDRPVLTGLRLFFAPWTLDAVRAELEGQLERFRVLTGRMPAFVNGHLNLHVHPSVVPIVAALAQEHGITAVRLPREPAGLVLAIDRHHAPRTRINAMIFDRLSARAARLLGRAGVRSADRCFGVLRPFAMTEALLAGLLPRLGSGTTEIYLHPGHAAHGGRDLELAALRSDGLRELVARLGFEVTCHDDAFATEAVALAAPDDRAS